MQLKRRWKVLIAFASALLLLNIYYLFTTPPGDGPWQQQYQKLATVEIHEDHAIIHNFRRARYDKAGKTESVIWEDRTIDLAGLKSVWYGISVFASPGLAHTFLSFDFGDGGPVVISVEARMRPDQSYHPMVGALDAYQLTYVIADERDVIGVRTHKRSDEVIFMPLTVPKERAHKMFLDMILRANKLAAEPAEYNTFTSNCTNSIMKQTKVPAWQYYLDWRIILPGFSDRIAYSYGVLDQNFSREAIRKAATIKAEGYSDDDPDYSMKIRQEYYDALTEGSG